MIKPPRLVANRDPSERHATWLELFYDLVFVVAIAKVSERLADNPSWLGLGQFVALFVIIWWAWIGQIVYMTRFDTEDLIHQIITFALMLGAAGLSIQVKNAFEDGSIGFVLAYIFLRLILLFLYWRAWRAVPEARKVTRVYLTGYSIGVSLWIISLFLPAPYQYGLWGVGLAVDLTTPWIGKRQLQNVPVDATHMPERLAQFNIIVLGETITGTIEGVAKVQWEFNAVVIALLTFLLAALIWWKYFTFYQDAELGRHLGTGLDLIYSHLPFIVGIAVSGVGAQKAILEATHPQLSNTTLLLLTGGTALWVLAALLIKWSTYQHTPAPGLLISHAGAILATIAVGGLGLALPPPIVLLLINVIAFGLLVVQVRYDPHFQQADNASSPAANQPST